MCTKKQKRTNVEKRLKNDFFNIKLGTVNKNNPEVIYFEVRTFISPLEENNNYSQVFAFLKKEFSKKISDSLKLNDFFSEKYILDFQIANSGIKINKKSYLSFQLFLKQKNEVIKELKEIKKIAEPFLVNLLNEFKTDIISNNFSVTKTKKETIYCKS
jgi:hypothetical protein